MVRWATNEATSNALKKISAEVQTEVETAGPSAGIPVMVFNPLAWSRTDLVNRRTSRCRTASNTGLAVLDPQGKPMPFQEISKDSSTHTYHLLIETKNVPPFGYEVLQVVPGERFRQRPI